MNKKKISVLMDSDIHTELKKIQKEKELVSISSAIRYLLSLGK